MNTKKYKHENKINKHARAEGTRKGRESERVEGTGSMCGTSVVEARSSRAFRMPVISVFITASFSSKDFVF